MSKHIQLVLGLYAISLSAHGLDQNILASSPGAAVSECTTGIMGQKKGHTLGVDEEGSLVLVTRPSPPKMQIKLRANAEFWLCRDDSFTGKFGNPDKVKLRVEDQEYQIWVEPRGFSEGENEYGLVPVVPGEGYSSRFLAVDDKLGLLRIVDKWTTDQAKFRCVE